MKKLLLLLMLVTLVACNQSEDDLHDSQEWSSDTIPNPEDGSTNSKYTAKNEKEGKSSSESTTPFKKEEIAGAWEVKLTVTSTNCEGITTNEEKEERWFVNFETGELNITVMTKGSKTKEYWGYFTGKNLEALADKKLTKQEMISLNSKNVNRNTLNLKVENSNSITGNRVDISKDLCRTDYSIIMTR
ncbi:MAG: hypothetical protein CVV25_02785 [Ignavibacteriae bacterium HGW-Ignavibacteriae-4]|jgi:Tfp pilus assembly protein PilP|nr:MAG: hypothetical protein CVV25_02785 [Ignavibacteriae bacterium HGW-Ignavibacteriae-4]